MGRNRGPPLAKRLMVVEMLSKEIRGWCPISKTDRSNFLRSFRISFVFESAIVEVCHGSGIEEDWVDDGCESEGEGDDYGCVEEGVGKARGGSYAFRMDDMGSFGDWRFYFT